ncbi:hypothetical protein J6590_091654 [Homalodisca vitripennis]|nr:hypothetical protein J6590_091654 [Homalodisca vitripennis]
MDVNSVLYLGRYICVLQLLHRLSDRILVLHKIRCNDLETTTYTSALSRKLGECAMDVNSVLYLGRYICVLQLLHRLSDRILVLHKIRCNDLETTTYTSALSRKLGECAMDVNSVLYLGRYICVLQLLHRLSDRILVLHKIRTTTYTSALSRKLGACAMDVNSVLYLGRYICVLQLLHRLSDQTRHTLPSGRKLGECYGRDSVRHLGRYLRATYFTGLVIEVGACAMDVNTVLHLGRYICVLQLLHRLSDRILVLHKIRCNDLETTTYTSALSRKLGECAMDVNSVLYLGRYICVLQLLHRLSDRILVLHKIRCNDLETTTYTSALSRKLGECAMDVNTVLHLGRYICVLQLLHRLSDRILVLHKIRYNDLETTTYTSALSRKLGACAMNVNTVLHLGRYICVLQLLHRLSDRILVLHKIRYNDLETTTYTSALSRKLGACAMDVNTVLHLGRYICVLQLLHRLSDRILVLHKIRYNDLETTTYTSALSRKLGACAMDVNTVLHSEDTSVCYNYFTGLVITTTYTSALSRKLGACAMDVNTVLHLGRYICVLQLLHRLSDRILVLHKIRYNDLETTTYTSALSSKLGACAMDVNTVLHSEDTSVCYNYFTGLVNVKHIFCMSILVNVSYYNIPRLKTKSRNCPCV